MLLSPDCAVMLERYPLDALCQAEVVVSGNYPEGGPHSRPDVYKSTMDGALCDVLSAIEKEFNNNRYLVAHAVVHIDGQDFEIFPD